MADSQAVTFQRRILTGGCHCNAFVYEIEGPAITTAVDCNCSICSRKGYLWHFTGKDDKFTIVRGAESDLTEYKFGAGELVHMFCPNCGMAIMARMPGGPPEWQLGLNVRMMQDIDESYLETEFYDGAALGSQYDSPAHRGPLPETKEDEKVYTGSCHCGGVTVAVASVPLDATILGSNVKGRGGNDCVWICAKTEHVILSPDKDLTGEYCADPSFGSRTFCRTCGVTMTAKMHKLSVNESSEIIPTRPEASLHEAEMLLVNINVLHGIDFEKVEV